MAYIGKQPVVGNFVKLDAITTSATTTFNLLSGGVAYFPQTANNCIVSLNGVIQSPTSAYTISGSTIVFSDALTSSDTIDFILVLGDVLSIGTPSDNSVTLNKLTATGTKDATTFLRGDNTFATVSTDGTADWDTTVKTTGFTATANKGYFCNTTSSAFTVTLPATPSAGDEVIILDYAGTFDTNPITISPNGVKIEGATSSLQLTGEREGVRLVYIDSTQGWLAYSGINEGTDALSPVPITADFLVIAGGGSGGHSSGSGGGAGGYRNSYSTETSGGGGSSETSLTLTPGTVYTITVGAGGAAVSAAGVGNNGNDSSISGTGISTITSTGGGAGGQAGSGGGNGGSGGGSGGNGTANQGYNGGSGGNAGGGGAGEAGNTDGTGFGGDGLSSSITGTSVARGGGGGANSQVGGDGGGGSGAGPGASESGVANTGGGGAWWNGNGTSSGAGGSGVVILRLPTSSYSGTTTGSPTVSTSGSDTILVYNASGSYTG